MKINITSSLLLSLLLFFGACNQENPSDQNPSRTIVELDLTKSKLSFKDVKDNLLSANDIKIKFMNYERTVKNVQVDKNIVLEDGVMLISDNDSISFAVTDSYVSIISRINPNREDKILIHEDSDHVEEYLNSIVLPITRSISDSSNVEIKLLSQGVLSISGGWNVQQTHVHPEPEENRVVDEIQHDHVTRSSIWPDRNPDVIRIWLIRHRGYGGSYEITWQQQHVKSMIHKINPKAKIEFYTRGSDFRAVKDPYQTLKDFDSWLLKHRRSGYEWSGSVDKDIFVLLSYGAYGSIAGLAYQDSYSIKYKYNPRAIGISAINPVTADKTLAHEIAHILGAKHTNYAWKEGWWIFKIWMHDLMSYKWPRSAWTQEPNNVRAIKNSTTL